jgi:hypothetical protein
MQGSCGPRHDDCETHRYVGVRYFVPTVPVPFSVAFVPVTAKGRRRNTASSFFGCSEKCSMFLLPPPKYFMEKGIIREHLRSYTLKTMKCLGN